MASKRERIAGELDANIMEKQNVRYNVRIALKYYRYLRAFAANAVDSMDWYINGQNIPAHIQSIAQSRVETLTLLTHIDTAINTYTKMCEEEGTVRSANVLIRKYIDPPEGLNKTGKPYTNEQLADLFDCDERTIRRDLSIAIKKVSILFFGAHGLF